MNAVEQREIEEIEEFNSYVQKPKKRNKIIVALVIMVIIFLLTSVFSTAFALFNKTSTKIIQGVSIRNIDVSGLTKDEAKKKVTEILNSELQKDIVLKYKDYTTTLKPSQIQFKYNIEDAVNKAYQVGREENIIESNYKIIDTFMNKIDIPIINTYNKELENQLIFAVEEGLPDAVEQPSYYIENGNIILLSGNEGTIIQKEKLSNSIIETIIDENNIEKQVEIPVELIKPYQTDVDKFRELIYVAPQNAYYTSDPFVVYPEVIGVDFNADEVKQMLKEYKDSYTIPLIYTFPEITKNEIGTEAFPDLLASFSTRYNASDTNRTTNLRLASEKINGTVLIPGEEFSYNTIVGERTTAAGYKDAKIFSDGEIIDGLGGGICQISSTLYNAALYANLEITDRRNHQFVTSYLKAGLDATVVYGSQDFKFKNSRQYPIKIVSEVKNGTAKIQIYGLREEVEYDIKLEPVVQQSNSNSIKTVTYKYKYLNGQEIDKTIISKDTYKRN